MRDQTWSAPCAIILGESPATVRCFQGDGFLDGIWSDVKRIDDSATALLGAALARWCQADPKPLVVCLICTIIDSLDRRYS